ncbi:hypothetical protein RB593_000589 [Gaeumannomyces tritici]
MRLRSSLALAAIASVARAQYLLNELSFGFGSKISENGQMIPHYSLQGQPYLPEVMSNKVVLTPPAPGNLRGAIWADNPLEYDEWTADVSFRVNGPERGGGNVNIWLVRDGSHEVRSGGVYTVAHFQGLVLAIDQYGGSGGMIRGFLNDGSTDFKASHVDGLSFGHCNYAYRNLGRPSEIKISQSHALFKVEVDGHPCFQSDHIEIPRGYRFGVTAASAENPDSVELFKLVVLSDKHDNHHEPEHYDQHHDEHHDQKSQYHEDGDHAPPSKFTRGHGHHDAHHDDETYSYEADIPDQDAGKLTSSLAQFEDLHNRLQSVNHHLSAIFRSISHQSTMDERRHEEISTMIHSVKVALDKLTDLDNRLQSVEREVRSVKSDITHKVQSTENNIKSIVGDTHSYLAKKVEQHAAPGHGRLIFVIVGSQVILISAFIVYKRRKSSMPKKYL